ncbi:hypothetical protein SCUCBS95973_004119 [Sporothrix curviconia]|uniref:Uncharacterized protein n=1 Tax=Sporothrix curviconia TaxID=1260050 RepID=A0ABP0BLJ3_9PEZI
MASLFCCSSIQPYRPQYLTHQSKFVSFMAWGSYPRVSALDESVGHKDILGSYTPPFAIQLVQQVNYGALESKRYFVPVEGNEAEFVQNYKCSAHDKFFEVNVYQKDPFNKHHWRANLARPASDIDL